MNEFLSTDLGVAHDEPSGGPGIRPGLWRGMPRIVWVAAGLWTALLLVWTLVVPMFRAPDENQHVAAAVHLQHHRTWPGFKELPPDRGVQQAPFTYRVVRLAAEPHPPLETSRAMPRGSRPSFEDLGGGEHGSGVLTVGQHPPGYYALIGSVAWALPSSTPADLEVWAMRVLSVVLLCPLPIVVAATVRRLGGPTAAVATAAILPFAVPELAVVGSAVNSDNLLNAAAMWMTLGLVLVATGDLRARTGALIGLAAAVGLFAKAFALLLVPVLVAAYLLGGRRRGGLRSCLPGLGAFAVASFLGGWWWFHNLIRYGQVQPSGHGPPRPEGRLGLFEVLGEYLGHVWERVPGRFWAVIGMKGEGAGVGGAFPVALVAVLSVLLLGVLTAALVRRRTYRATRADVVLLLAPLGLVTGTLLLSTWNIYARTGYPAGLQGRYLFVALPGVFVVIALVLSRWTSGWPPHRLPTAVAAFSGMLVLLSLARAVRYHWGADRSSIADVPGALLAWAPLPSWSTLAVIGLLPVALVALVAALLDIRSAGGGSGSGDGSRSRGVRPSN